MPDVAGVIGVLQMSLTCGSGILPALEVAEALVRDLLGGLRSLADPDPNNPDHRSFSPRARFGRKRFGLHRLSVRELQMIPRIAWESFLHKDQVSSKMLQHVCLMRSNGM
jgi:hypothetical protein